MDARARTPWLIVGAAVIVGAAIVAAAFIIANQPDENAAAEPSTPSTSAEADAPPTAVWPPPLPPGVPSTGEHAWRATWTPDPDAEQQFIADLADTDSGAFTWGPGFVPSNTDRLIDMGYAICEDYYQGVSGPDMTDRLHLPSSGLPGPSDVDRIMQAARIELAARANFCMNIDPWGEAY